jgi:hypothetical protein
MQADQATQKSFSETEGPLGGLPLPAVKELEDILAEMGVHMDTQDVDRFGQFILTIVKHSVKN